MRYIIWEQKALENAVMQTVCVRTIVTDEYKQINDVLIFSRYLR